MKFIRIILGSALCLFVYSSSNARLGETPDELKARFGDPTSTANEITIAQGRILEFGSQLRFKQGDWSIAASIVEGRSVKEVYSHKGDWTEAQFTTVLTGNSQGATWAESDNSGSKKLTRSWKRSDGAAATWAINSMTVDHPAYGRAKAKAEAKGKAEAGRVPEI